MKQPSTQLAVRPAAARPRIVDVVFGVPEERRFALPAGVLIALVIHALFFTVALRSERSLESWSAAMAAQVHAALAREQFIELAPPPPPPSPPEQPPPPPAPSAPKLKAPREPKKVAERSTPPPPAQAGNIVARETRPDEPADLTGDTFVTGSASTYAGGVTSSSGTNPVAVQTREVDPRASPAQPDRSSPVSLEEEPDCRSLFPREADDAQIDEQIVIIRLVVRADGTPESAKILRDPGHGFGQAAIACAMQRTQFRPARDRQGRPIRAESPPIRMRFTR